MSVLAPRVITRGMMAAALLSITAALRAQAPNFLPVPEITSLSRLGAQRGTTVDVTVTGQHLDGATALLFANPGITGDLKPDAPASANTATFSVRIPADAAPGTRDLRLRGKFGLSNPRSFCIGTFPETIIPTAGISPENATPVTLNSVTGAATTPGARSWFKLHATADQRLWISVESPDTRLEPQITLNDAQLRPLRRTAGPLPIDFTPGAAADLFIEIHDLLYRGGPDHRFRLVVSAEPMPEQRPRIMASAFTDGAEITRIDTAAGRSGPDPVPRDLKLTPPCEHISLFPAGGKPATFVFAARKGEVWWLDVLSHSLGHASAPVLVLEKADSPGRPAFIAEGTASDPTLSAAGFNLEIRDCSLRFEPKDDGQYRVKVRDAFNTSPGSPRLPCRLAIRRESPDFRLVAVPDQPPRQRPPTSAYLLPPTLRRGGVASLRVFARRQDGFSGEIRLSAEGLPPGVTCPGATLGNGDDAASLTFVADEKAEPWAGFLRITGTARINGNDVRREVRGGSLVWTVNDTRQDSFRCRIVDGLALSVIADEAPVLLEPQVNGAIKAKPGDKIRFDVKVVRRGGYSEPLKLRPHGLGEPDKAAAIQLDIPAKSEMATIEINLANLNVKPGEHTLVLSGPADRVKYRKNVDELPAAEAKAKRLAQEAMAAGTGAESASGEPAKDAQQRLKAAQQARADAEKRAKDLAKLAEPRDMTFPVWSRPVKIVVREAPAK